jgi:hydroxyacylglutathione hydrolase
MEGDVPHPLYFRQLLSGRDHSQNADHVTDPDQSIIFQVAKSMVNFQYLIGDAVTKDVAVIDACWDIDGIMICINQDGMTLTHGLCTHFHFDHVGGKVPKWFRKQCLNNAGPATIPGIKEIYDKDVPCYIHERELKKMSDDTGIPRSALNPLREGSVLHVGRTRILVLHTPGHTYGSVCYAIIPDGSETPTMLITGDTVFPCSCGRTDLAESNKSEMRASLTRLASDSQLSDDVIIYGGHAYGRSHTTMSCERHQGILNPAMICQAVVQK